VFEQAEWWNVCLFCKLHHSFVLSPSVDATSDTMMRKNGFFSLMPVENSGCFGAEPKMVLF
jgi:hypothetical protein